jgi:hypothetical protein
MRRLTPSERYLEETKASIRREQRDRTEIRIQQLLSPKKDEKLKGNSRHSMDTTDMEETRTRRQALMSGSNNLEVKEESSVLAPQDVDRRNLTSRRSLGRSERKPARNPKDLLTKKLRSRSRDRRYYTIDSDWFSYFGSI